MPANAPDHTRDSTLGARRALLLLAIMGSVTALLLVVCWDDVAGAPPTSLTPVVTATTAHPLTGPPAASGAVVRKVVGTAPVALRYAFAPDDRPTYEVQVTQKMTMRRVDSESRVVTTIAADVAIEPAPEAGKVYLAFTGFELSIDADGEAVELPAVHSLLDGIRLLVELDPQTGIGSDTTLSGVNPQVRRLLTVLVDAIRQSHPALPLEPVGDGGTWERASHWEDTQSTKLTSTIDETHRLERVGVGVRIHRTSQMHLEGAPTIGALTGEGQGSLVATLDPQSGILSASEGDFAFEQAVQDGDGRWTQRLELAFTLTRHERR